jgi:ribonuclease H-related protein
MGKRNFSHYAVRAGRKPGIYTTWAECWEQVHHFNGNEYKGFQDIQEAEAYMKTKELPATASVLEVSKSQQEDSKHFDIYTDGSYDSGKYSWAFVAYQNSKLIHKESALGVHKRFLKHRNVVAEIEAVINAVQWAETQGATSVTIYHDYKGPSEWASGDWKANYPLTQDYVKFIRPHLDWVNFKKVPAHSGIEGNELADKLATEALNG